MTLTKVGDWNNARAKPFHFNPDCFGCVDFRYASGLNTPPAQKEGNIISIGGGGGVKVEIVLGSLAGLLALFVAFYVFEEKEEEGMRRRISTLEAELTLLKEYDQHEKDMIDNEITGFRKNFEEHRDKNKAASTERDELDKFIIPASEVTPVKMIGKGSFGEVFLADYRGQQVAVKTMSSIDAENLSRFRDEIILMSDLHHPNVVFMVGACWEKQLMALVLEFCDKGTASDCLAPDLTWGDPLFKWAKDISLGIGYLHNISFFDTKNNIQVSNIIHRDIKPDNCLVTDTFGVKVSDFGEARMADVGKTMTMVGTPFYVAPEVIRGDHYSTSADVYSYALTLVCFATKQEHLNKWLKKAYVMDRLKARDGKKAAGTDNVSDNRIAHLMCNKSWRPSDALIDDLNVPSKMAQLIEICWLDDPTKRPTFKEIKTFLVDQCMEEIMGSEGGERGSRRQSTTGMRMVTKILQNEARRKEEKNLEGDNEEEVTFRGGEWKDIKKMVEEEGGAKILKEVLMQRKKMREAGIN